MDTEMFPVFKRKEIETCIFDYSQDVKERKHRLILHTSFRNNRYP
jgi:hypothetical protein